MITKFYFRRENFNFELNTLRVYLHKILQKLQRKYGSLLETLDLPKLSHGDF